MIVRWRRRGDILIGASWSCSGETPFKDWEVYGSFGVGVYRCSGSFLNARLILGSKSI